MVHIQEQDRAPAASEDCGSVYVARICPDTAVVLIGVTSYQCGGSTTDPKTPRESAQVPIVDSKTASPTRIVESWFRFPSRLPSSIHSLIAKPFPSWFVPRMTNDQNGGDVTGGLC